MTGIQDKFTRKIFKINGVKGYILARDDGQVLAHKLMDGNLEALSAMMVISSMGCKTVKSDMGFSDFNYFMITKDNDEILYVFPLKNYYLGVLQTSGDYQPEFIKNIELFIAKIIRSAKRQR